MAVAMNSHAWEIYAARPCRVSTPGKASSRIVRSVADDPRRPITHPSSPRAASPRSAEGRIRVSCTLYVSAPRASRDGRKETNLFQPAPASTLAYILPISPMPIIPITGWRSAGMLGVGGSCSKRASVGFVIVVLMIVAGIVNVGDRAKDTAREKEFKYATGDRMCGVGCGGEMGRGYERSGLTQYNTAAVANPRRDGTVSSISRPGSAPGHYKCLTNAMRQCLEVWCKYYLRKCRERDRELRRTRAGVAEFGSRVDPPFLNPFRWVPRLHGIVNSI